MYNSFIQFDKIIRISTEGMEEGFIQIITVNGSFMNKKSLAQIKLLLPNSFIQIDSGNIINVNFIEGLNEHFSLVYMKGIEGTKELDMIPVDTAFREQLRERLDNELFV